MSDDLVKRADEVLEDVTPGPWTLGEYEDGLEVFTFKNELPRPLVSIDFGFNGVVDDENYANLRFIAVARELVPSMRDRIEADAKRIEKGVNAELLDQQQAMQERIAELEAALKSVLDACDQGRMIPRTGAGAGGMTIEANIRGSVFTGVPAWPIEEARAALGEKKE